MNFIHYYAIILSLHAYFYLLDWGVVAHGAVLLMLPAAGPPDPDSRAPRTRGPGRPRRGFRSLSAPPTFQPVAHLNLLNLPFISPTHHRIVIRIRPYEWLHMEVRGAGRLAGGKISGVLYVTPHRVVMQGNDGPAWSAPVGDLDVKAEGRTGVLSTPDGRRATWKSDTPVSWWGNAILFWKRGIMPDVKRTDGPPPAFGDIAELPEVLARTAWNIRWYGRETLAAEGLGTPPMSDKLESAIHQTNMILAALRHDGFPDGPPPVYFRMMLRRHALVHATHMVWGWKNGLQYITDVIRGRGHLARAGRESAPFADWPDRWYEPKPFAPAKRGWHHEINPASCGGHPYAILERCRAMIPVMTRVADELHENPTHNPYLRMRQLYEAIRDGKPLPPPPREALPLARAAASDPW